MIRINLLPKKSKPLVTLWRDTAILGGTIFLLITVTLVFTVKMNGRIKRLTRKMNETKRQIESAKKDLEKIETLKNDMAILENKVRIINSLRQKQSWPVHMLEDLGFAIPEQVWLENLTNQETSLQLGGMTPSYNAVSEFMRNLSSSPYFKSIELENIQQSPSRGKNFHRFKVTCQIELVPKSSEEQGEKGKS